MLPERNPHKPQQEQGVFLKYFIERTDGKQIDETFLFVLTPETCRYSREALKAYANACKDDYPVLSNDLFAKLNEIEGHRDEGYRDEKQK